jgi:Cu(I)-responsive transcriptional regulator
MKSIGAAARDTGVSAKMIRHYDAIGLVRPSARSDSGYRYYNDADLHALRFVGRARSLGFSLEHTRRLLALWRDRRRASAAVKSLALAQVAELDRKIAELGEMRAALGHLAAHCEGNERPNCPILDDLSR